jgi:hypothetical protein
MRQPWTVEIPLGGVLVAPVIAVLTLVAVAGPASVIAAEPATVPGARVRVTTSQGRLIGRFLELKGEAFVLERQKGDAPEKVTIDRRDVLGLEVSQRRSKKGKGANIGVLAGLGAAIAIGALGGESCSSEPVPADLPHLSEKLNQELCIGPGGVALLSAIVTVPLGALVGAAVMPGEKWSPAPVSGFVVQPMAARGGGLGLRVAIGF